MTAANRRREDVRIGQSIVGITFECLVIRYAPCTLARRGRRGAANLRNVVTVPVFFVALRAAVRRRPRTTAFATVLTMAPKLAFVNERAKLYDREAAAE